jgi:hypothetical protein
VLSGRQIAELMTVLALFNRRGGMPLFVFLISPDLDASSKLVVRVQGENIVNRERMGGRLLGILWNNFSGDSGKVYVLS